MSRWAEDRGLDIGAVLSTSTVWDLSRVWYEGRDREEWQPRTADQTAAVFDSVGLTGPFWSLS